MSISKKHDWKKGRWAFSLKVITPDGTTMEYDMPHIGAAKGKSFWDAVAKLAGLKG